MNQLKHQFLTTAFTQLKERTASIPELTQLLLPNKSSSLNDLQQTDLKSLQKAAQELVDLTDILLELDIHQLTLLLDDTILQSQIKHIFLSQPLLTNILQPDFFRSTLGHKLRTQANSIIGFASVLLTGNDGPLNEEQKNTLVAIKNVGKILLDFVNDKILAVWQIESYRTGNKSLYYFEEISVETSLKEFRTWGSKHLEFAIDVELPSSLPPIMGDMRNGLQNIVYLTTSALSDNFTRGSLTIGASVKNDHMVVRIKNREFILPEDVLQEFKRVGQASTLFVCHRFDSALDLCISQALVKIHEGEMYLDNQKVSGTLAEVAFPINHRHVPQPTS